MILDPRNFICMAINHKRASCVKPAINFVEAEGATRAACTSHTNNYPVNGWYTSVEETLTLIAAAIEPIVNQEADAILAQEMESA